MIQYLIVNLYNMHTFLRNNISYIEIILICSGLFFFISTIYIAQGGDLMINYLAKAFYILGIILLVFKK
jgi:hypothetical protein